MKYAGYIKNNRTSMIRFRVRPFEIVGVGLNAGTLLNKQNSRKEATRDLLRQTKRKMRTRKETPEQRRLDGLYPQALSELADIGIVPEPIEGFYVNYRAKSFLGRATRYADGVRVVEIVDLMLYDFVPDRVVKTVIVHEILHCVKGTRGHTGKWLMLAGIVNQKLGYNITRRADEESMRYFNKAAAVKDAGKASGAYGSRNGKRPEAGPVTGPVPIGRITPVKKIVVIPRVRTQPGAGQPPVPGSSVQGGIIPASGFLPAPVDRSRKGSMPKANAPIVRNDPAPGPRRRTAILPAPPTVADRPVRIPAMFSAPVPEERAAL
ncbi:MAG: hypothetical protein IIY88_07470, partial [Eubacterium sp.]|nr:hypothetical protein [Eubacterium sp.]